MGNKELRLNYQEAIQLIRVGRFEEALTLLKEIDRERPNVKNVLYPMAFCCEKLGYAEEGLDLCDHLIAEYNHEKARSIKARIELSSAIPEAEEIEPPEETSAIPEAPALSVEMDEQPEPEPEAEFEPMPEPEPEPEFEYEAEPVSNNNGNEAVGKTHHKRPIWLVLLVALVAAAAVAFLLHKFVLKSF